MYKVLVVDDEEKIRNSDIDFGIVTFNITTKEPVIIFKDEMPKEKMIDYILASANYPVFYRKEIDEEIQKYIATLPKTFDDWLK